MRTSSKLLLLGALAAFGSAACGDFLSGPGLTTDPNAPSAATRDQRLVSVQAAMVVQLTGTLARSACMWMQQCAGVDRQYATLETYNTTSSDFDTEFTQVYTGGGLIDIRAIEADAAGAGDSVYVGVAKVLEALNVGTAADLWGDIPYSQAVGSNTNPSFDTQQSIYAALLTLLDQAIAELGGPGAGPGQIDLWYLGDKTAWTELAHTLKARIYLHLAQRNGVSAYTSALTEANLGLSTAAHDLTTYQSTATTEWNVWYQFQIIQRDTYLRMGWQLVDFMLGRADPRLSAYFSTITPPPWQPNHKYTVCTRILDSNGNLEEVSAATSAALDSSGATQPTWPGTFDATTTDHQVTWSFKGAHYGGACPGNAYDPAQQSNLSNARLAQNFRQPLATHAEVQLIAAEAAYQTGNQAAALSSLNAERASVPLPAIPGTVTGAALLDSIMIEKYVVMFQNIETWNDLKRECIPALVPANLLNAGGHVIARPFYGVTEISTNANAANDPQVAAEAAGQRNWNDPRSAADPCP